MRSPPRSFVQRAGFDAVGVFDVIEHVDDAEAFVRCCSRLVRSGGRLVGTVPALQMLWSDYDRASGHRIRYTRGKLRALLDRAGLQETRCDYFFRVLVPGLLARRFLIGRRSALGFEDQRRIFRDSLRPPGAAVNALFMSLCDAEGLAMHALPFGFLPGASIWFSAVVP